MVDAEFEAVLAALAASGLDLQAFEPAARRQAVARRMRELGLSDLGAYRAVLDTDGDEAGRLADRVFLGYTAFLRDAQAWRHLARRVLPGLTPPVRAWSAGCGTGEEAYTIAMLLADRHGAGAGAFDVLATDVDTGVLAAAEAGVYSAAVLRAAPRRWRRRYCHRVGEDYGVAPHIRARVAVARHDLVHDPPPPCLDVVVCRHTLMYFHPRVQQRVLDGFARAVRPGGALLCERTDIVEAADWTPLGAGLYRRTDVHAFG